MKANLVSCKLADVEREYFEFLFSISPEMCVFHSNAMTLSALKCVIRESKDRKQVKYGGQNTYPHVKHL